MTEPGSALRGLRRAAGLTQEQLAEISGVSVRSIRRLEHGAPLDARMATVSQLASALGVPVQALVPAAGTAGDAPGGPVAPTAPAPAAGPLLHGHGLLDEAAGELAREVRRRWRREEDQSRVRDPFQLPVRWQPAPADLVDRWDNIQRLGPGSVAKPLELAGDLAQVAQVHRRIPSGRMVVLGRAGAGKSVLAIRLVLDLLETGCTQVPVIFGLGAWDPTAVSLPDWLVGQLLRDHPQLARRSPGGTQSLAEALVHGDAVLPVLDGFDEIAEGLREAALRELNATSSALVVTSRRDEYAEAVRATGTPLAWAACVELGDLTAADLAHYLPRTSHLDGARDWGRVLAAVEDPDHPASARITETLSTPLMVALARVLYSNATGPAPDELLDGARFPDARALEEHLLSGFVPALYRPRAPEATTTGHGRPHRTWHPAQAGRWLGYLAHGLATPETERHDLAWWQLADSLHRGPRTLAVVLATTACLTVSIWPIMALAPLSATQVLLLGLLLGPAAGLTFGCTQAFADTLRRRPGTEPTRTRLRMRGHRRMARRPRRAFAAHLGAALLGGFVMGAGTAVAITLERSLVYGFPITAPGVPQFTIVNVIVFGLIFGTAAPLTFGLLMAFQAPLDTTSAATPSALLATNRAEAARQLLILAPLLTATITGVGQALVTALHGTLGPLVWGLDGLEVGAIGGTGGAAAYILTFTAWGQWLVLVRFWLPLTGRLPWNTAVFLEDAYHRGALRRCGAVYQFRHVRLQHHLARAHRRRTGRFTDANMSSQNSRTG